MLYLLLAILSSALISIFMRVSEKYISYNFGMLAVNYITCSVLACLYTGPSRLFLSSDGMGSALTLGVITGIFYLTSFILLQWNVAKNGVVMASTFMKLGVLVPTVLSVLLFGEMPKIAQILGFIGALAAILLIHFDGSSTKVSNRAALLFLLLCGGVSDFMSKIFEQASIPSLKDRYLVFTFLTALILCTGLILIKKQRIGKMELLFGLLVGIPNYFCSLFLLRALDSLPAVVVYPTFSVGIIVVVTLAGLLFFREKLGRMRGIAIGIILISLLLLNL